MILIITNRYDLHADKVAEALTQKGHRCIRLDTETFPEQSMISLFHSTRGTNSVICVNDQQFAVNDVSAVWNRRTQFPSSGRNLNEHDQRLVRDESNHVLGSLWQLLRKSFWVNPYWLQRAAHHKPYQLQVAADVGLTIPRTVITNDPEQAVSFFRECGGDVVYKSLSSHTRECDATGYGIYTTRVTKDDLIKHAKGISLAPCQFQEYIPKKVELRITIIGNQMFAAELHTQLDERSSIDWRRHLMEFSFPYRVVELPQHFRVCLSNFMDRMGLVFGCVDAIVTPDEHYVFLEVNATGQWIWIEQNTGMPLMDCFTEMLIQATPTYTIPREREIPSLKTNLGAVGFMQE